jgi:F-type H+-transporting ATPase subunit epsilon
MKLEVITPEKKLFEGEVKAVQFPGINGSFQLLENHAPIISALGKGKIKIDLDTTSAELKVMANEVEKDDASDKVIRLMIKGGVVECRNNKVIVLAE